MSSHSLETVSARGPPALRANIPGPRLKWSDWSLPDINPSETMRKWRRSERAQMIEVIGDLIEESRRRAKSKYTPSRERARWIRLAGQLIWYKDQILRSMTDEAVEEDVKQLQEEVQQLKEMEEKPPRQSFPRRTIETTPLRVERRRKESPGMLKDGSMSMHQQ